MAPVKLTTVAVDRHAVMRTIFLVRLPLRRGFCGVIAHLHEVKVPRQFTFTAGRPQFAKTWVVATMRLVTGLPLARRRWR
jgi:hypothetical protein